MAKRGNIVQYRERLDRTLASPDLTNEQKLKTLVKSQLQCSSNIQRQGDEEKTVETKTSELCNFLDMLRSASGDNSGGSSVSHTDWKLKQDNEELRVMYCEGPEGTPYHTLLVEGYVDGPLDLCLCLSWDTTLYKKWWPQFTIPSFKVIVAERLQKIRNIGEQISLVRMKVSWPLATREAIVHYDLFEYFQDDLVAVLLKTVPESKIIGGLNKEIIPEAKDVVRIDVVGGYVMQKVSSERSYFRIIANLDIKLDLVPPTLINFISRQLIGSGFRLYQKAVASMKGHNKDKEFSKALEDPLYVRVREVLFNINGSNAMEREELKQDASTVPSEELIQSDKDVSCEDSINQCTNNCNSENVNAGSEETEEADFKEIVQIDEDVEKVVDVPNEEGDSWSAMKRKRSSEIIVDADNEEIVQIEKDVNKVHNDVPIEDDDTRSVVHEKMDVRVRSDVRKAIDTIERVISMVKECGFHSLRSTPNFPSLESHREKSGSLDSSSEKLVQVCLKNEVHVKVSSTNIVEETLEESGKVQSFRHTGTNLNLKEVNYNKVVPASPEQSLSRLMEASDDDSHSFKSRATLDQTIYDNKKLNSDVIQDVPSDDLKKSTSEIKYRYCCFLY